MVDPEYHFMGTFFFLTKELENLFHLKQGLFVFSFKSLLIVFTCNLFFFFSPNFQSFLLVGVSTPFLPCLVLSRNHYREQRWTSTKIPADVWSVSLSLYPRSVPVWIL